MANLNFRYLFHAMVSQKITYLCMTDEAVGRVAPFEFLSLIQQKFFRKIIFPKSAI
jgi:hypothetical protein